MNANPPDDEKFSILVVEDDFLIALDLQDALEQAGHLVVGPARKVSEALEMLKTATPDAAVLDANLFGERVTPVARLLKIMGIPFVLASADNAFVQSDAILAAVENIGKPTNQRRLLKSLQALLADDGR